MTSQGVDVSRSTISQLEEVSQKHEINVVAELGIDRLVQWIGVYVLTALAVIIKLTDIIAGSGLSCYPANFSSQVNSYLIQYASAYCWETSLVSSTNESCSELNQDTLNFLQDPYPLKVLLFALPYVLLGQSLFFAAMSALWHFRFGARLQGHLRFMKLLLEDIYTQLKYITKGFYAAMPYDRTSIYFDGLQTYEAVEEIEKKEMRRKAKIEIQKYERKEAKLKAKQVANQSPKSARGTESSGDAKVETTVGSKSSLNKSSLQTADQPVAKQPNTTVECETKKEEETSLLQNEESANIVGRESGTKSSGDTGHVTSEAVGVPTQDANPQPRNSNDNINSQARTSSTVSSDVIEKQNEDEEITAFERFLVGEMRDQHLFSMLCCENFSSLHHLPYILSVYKLTRSWDAPPSEDTADDYYVDEGILKLWCHSKNLRQVRLVKWYFLKHLVTGAFALSMAVLMLILFGICLKSGFDASETFRCQLPFEDVCMLCIVKRKMEIYVVLFVDIAVTSLIALLSFGTLFVIRRSKDRVTSCFFKQIDISNIALAAAWRDRQEAEK